MALAKQAYRLILVAPDLNQVLRAVDGIKSNYTETEASFVSLDITHFDAVREFDAKLRRDQ